MVEEFQFSGTGRLLFGPGRLNEAGSLINLAESVLICGTSFLKGPHSSDIKKNVKYQFTVPGEPDPELIDGICREVKGKVSAVIAVGGGSVLDTGKAVAAMCLSDGSVEDYLEGVGTRKPEGKTLPVLAVPTTAGTGSEATKNAVVCRRGEQGFKKSLRHDNFIPSFVIIDPLLYLTCPERTIASCGMDAFSQLIESYISTKAGLYTDTLAWKGLELFVDFFPDLYSGKRKDIHSMGKIAFAAYLSGICLANAGLGTVHGIAGPLGGLYDIPHGTACGTLMPEIIKRTAESLSGSDAGLPLEKLRQTGLYIQRREGTGGDPVQTLIRWLEELQETLDIPRLSRFGVEEKHVQKIAALSGNKNHPVRFSREEIESILISRL